jgi:hypothetical protein
MMMSREKTIWVKPLHFKAEVKLDVDDVIIALTNAIKEDSEIRHMKSVSDLMHDLYLEARRENFKFKSLEEEELLEQFINFMENKRKGIPCSLHLESK